MGSNANSRAKIMRDWTVILKRNGRIIGSDRLRPVRFSNNDYNIGVELSFSGDLDDAFGMTTLKIKFPSLMKRGCYKSWASKSIGLRGRETNC